MPNLEEIVRGKHTQALRLVEEEILSKLKARKLSEAEVSKNYARKDISAAWQFGCELSCGEVLLNLLIPLDFPYTPPKVGLATPPPFLEFPHIEEDGILCAQPNSSTYASEMPLEMTHVVLSDSINLLEDNFSGKTKKDFQYEFLSYWERFLKNDKSPILSLVNPSGPHRVVKIWKGTPFSVIGESDNSIQTWLKNRYNKSFDSFYEAVFVWLPEPLFPNEYPKNNYDLTKLIADKTPDATSIISELAGKNPSDLVVLLGSESINGPCLAAVTLHCQNARYSKFHKSKSPLENGFRKGHAPATILSSRFLQSNNPITHHEIKRADPLWIHGRSGNPMQQEINKKRVIVIGCGSIGSLIAKHLAAAGVGEILLIDPEKLSSTNTARHFLGAKSVNSSKAAALAKILQEDYPHLEIKSKESDWQVVSTSEPELFESADLIISTTGNWASDSQLNEWQVRNEDASPIIYGWTEAYALAGHALCIINGLGCLRCNKSSDGEAELQVCKFPAATYKQEPACGVTYQPYGYIEVNHTITLISELAIETLMGRIATSTERLRSAHLSRLQDLGGEWTREWLDLTEGNNGGEIFTSRAWPNDTQCPICGARN